jgi:gas vesicle protein
MFMDETHDEETPAVEEVTAGPSQAPSEEEAPACGGGGGSLLGGLISGAVVGGALAMLLAPLRSEERARRKMIESGSLEGGELAPEEGPAGTEAAIDRVMSVVGGLGSRITAGWAALRGRLREAVEEGKEGIAEGQDEARARYEFMTRRRRPRR